MVFTPKSTVVRGILKGIGLYSKSKISKFKSYVNKFMPQNPKNSRFNTLRHLIAKQIEPKIYRQIEPVNYNSWKNNYFNNDDPRGIYKKNIVSDDESQFAPTSINKRRKTMLDNYAKAHQDTVDAKLLYDDAKRKARIHQNRLKNDILLKEL